MIKKPIGSIDQKSYDYESIAYNNQVKIQHHPQQVQMYVQQPQNKQLRAQNSLNSQPKKDIIVSLDDNYPIVFNVEPISSFENSSSHGLIDMSKVKRSLTNEKINTIVYDNKNVDSSSESSNETVNARRTNSYPRRKSSTSEANKQNTLSSKTKNEKQTRSSQKKLTKTMSTNSVSQKPKKKSLISCYLIQQYIIYLIISAIIISVSFGFYYMFVSMNLKLDSLEKRMNERMFKRLPIKIISKESFENANGNMKFTNNKNSNFYELALDDDEDYSDSSTKKTSHLKSNLKKTYYMQPTESIDDNNEFDSRNKPDVKSYNQLKNPKRNKDTNSESDLNEDNANAENDRKYINQYFNANYYVLKKINLNEFILIPAYNENSDPIQSTHCTNTKDYCVDFLKINEPVLRFNQIISPNKNRYNEDTPQSETSEVNNESTDEIDVEKEMLERENYFINNRIPDNSVQFRTVENDDDDSKTSEQRFTSESIATTTIPTSVIIFTTTSEMTTETTSTSTTTSTTSTLTSTTTSTTSATTLSSTIPTTTSIIVETTALPVTTKANGKKRNNKNNGTVVQNQDLSELTLFNSTLKHNKKKNNKNEKKNNENNGKNNKIRHRKRLETDAAKFNITNQNNTNFKSFIQGQQMVVPVESKYNHLCSLRIINPKPTYVVFMGVFHCNWMKNNGHENSNNNYYLTKGYKGSTVTICQSAEELKANRCYRHMPLKHSYYGTGHTIYKGYMFYNQDGTKDLISHGIEKDKNEVRKVTITEAACCDSSNNLYSVKHTGHFDFEVDEHGLWLIYKLEQHELNLSETNPTTDTYIVAKIKEKNYQNLSIERKWVLRLDRENVANMFITCGQLFALKNTHNNPATVYKLCDLFNDHDCSKSYENDAFNLTISSRQITSLSYNQDKKMLYMVDGGSFVNYKMEIVD